MVLFISLVELLQKVNLSSKKKEKKILTIEELKELNRSLYNIYT